jgi:hypothetical protein
VEESWYRTPGERWLEFLAMFVPAVVLTLVLQSMALWPPFALMLGFVGAVALCQFALRIVPLWRRVRFRSDGEAVRLDARERERPMLLGVVERALRMFLLLAALIGLMAPLPEWSVMQETAQQHPLIFGGFGLGLIAVSLHAGWKDENHHRSLPLGGLIGPDDEDEGG